MTENTYNVIKPDNSMPIKAWTKGVPLEDAARQQLLNVAQLPFIYKWVAAMPDVHWGMGATIGSVIPTRGAIIPAAVGVDIGCGMMAVQTSLHANNLPDNLHGIRTAIEKAVPHGRTDNGGKNNPRGAWSDAPAHHAEVWAKMEPAYQAVVEKIRSWTMCSASTTWGRWASGIISSKCASMKARTSRSLSLRYRVAWAIASARFSSSWRRMTCASG